MTDERDSKEKLAESLLSFKGRYHNHKETMAHAGVLLQVGLFSAIMKGWLPGLKGSVEIPTRIMAGIVFVLIWLLIYTYIRWQLFNRELAAKQINEMIKALVEKLTKQGSEPDSLDKAIQIQIDKGKGGEFGKWLVLCSSHVMFVIVLLRLFYSKCRCPLSWFIAVIVIILAFIISEVLLKKTMDKRLQRPKA